MIGKTKTPQFKNPFDLEDEDEEVLSVKTIPNSRQNNTVSPTVFAPFNPYEIQNQAPAVEKTKIKQTQYVPEPAQTKRVTAPFSNEHVPTRDYEPRPAPTEKSEKIYELDQNGDPPLLQDIGIQPDMIKSRIMDILKLAKPTEEVIEDPDLSGPIIIALLLGVLLLLSRKVQFGDIYALFVVGNILLFFLFNFMSQVQTIPLYSIMSTVGYALIPMLFLSSIGIFFSLKGGAGILLSLATSSFSSYAASNFIEALMRQTSSDRKPLLIYPLFLFYVSFALIIVF